MTQVWDNSKAEGAALLLLLAIADHCHDDGTGAWPSIARLASRTRQSERHTQRLLKSLRASGELEIRHASGPNMVNIYAIKMGGDKMSGGDIHGAESTPDVTGGVTSRALRGDIAVSPDPSGTVIEPSENHQGAVVGKLAGEKRSTIRNSTVIPERLNTPEFRAAWVMWLEHLKQKRKPPTLHAQDLQLRTLSAMGSAKAVTTISYCIEHNWQGIYEPPKSDSRLKHNPRNDGISNGPTDYGQAAKRKLERQALEDKQRYGTPDAGQAGA